MKRILTTLFALLVFSAASPALAQDDWDEDEEIGADEFEDETTEDDFGTDDPPEPVANDQGAPLGLAPAELGIGFRRTITGLTGPEVEFWLSDKLLITGGLSIGFQSPPGEGSDSSFILALSGGGFFNLLSGDRAALLGGGRLVVGFDSAAGFDTQTMESESAVQFNIEIPLRTEVFLSKALSIHFESGIAVLITSEDGSAIGGAPADATVITVGANAGLFGAAGVTLYWP